MPSKFKRAIGAVKDQTSISLAKVSSTNVSNIEVLILKATRHDDIPVDDRYVQEVLQLISSNKAYAASCAQGLARRISKTRNWVVAMKSLMLVLRVFQDGDVYFPREVLHQMKKGHKVLNLSTFRDDSNSSPWDFTAFVRTFALYLDERLDCFLRGKLQKRYTASKDKGSGKSRNSEPVFDMKPAMLLDKIMNWQRLLDRAMGTRPTGPARGHRLVQISFHAIVQESFDLYKDISDGLTLLLDNFFHLPHQTCLNAFQACIKASKQYDELCSFYNSCKSMGIGRTSEYPCVQKISEELIQTLQEFLKDKACAPANERSSPFLNAKLSIAVGPSSEHGENLEPSEQTVSLSESQSEYGSQCTSLEDLMSARSPLEVQDLNSDFSEIPSQNDLISDFSGSLLHNDDIFSAGDSVLNQSLPVDQQPGKDMALGDLFFENWPQEDTNQEQEQNAVENSLAALDFNSESGFDWELELAESENLAIVPFGQDPFDQEYGAIVPFGQDPFIRESGCEHQYNPFLSEETDVVASSSATIATSPQGGFPGANLFDMGETFQTELTFNPQNSVQTTTAMTFFPASPTFGDHSPLQTPMFSPPNFDQTMTSLTYQASPTFSPRNAVTPTFPASPCTDRNLPAPTFQASPTFSTTQNSSLDAFGFEDDLFGSFPSVMDTKPVHNSNVSVDPQNLLQEQHFWLQNQNKIISKHIS